MCDSLSVHTKFLLDHKPGDEATCKKCMEIITLALALYFISTREKGLDVSLFRYLSERHPSSLISLEKQYRMNR